MSIQKLARTSLKRIPVIALKPASVIEGDNPPETSKWFLNYVTGDHREAQLACAPEVFIKVRGKRKLKKAHTGYDLLLNSKFALFQDSGTKKIVSVDRWPEENVVHKMRPTDEALRERTHVVIEIEQDGTLDVLQFPFGLTEASLVRLMRKIDDVVELKEGDVVAGFSVDSIKGRTANFLVPDEEERTEHAGDKLWE